MDRNKKKGFTLIELLVVIAIIALLLSIVIPALHQAKEIAAAAVCMSNQRQLGTAYYMYADENDGYLVDGKPATNSTGYMDFDINGKNYRTHCFIAEPMNESGAFSNTSLEDKIRGFKVGGLWPYLETHEIFHCPMDKRWRKPPTAVTPTAQNAIGGYRSYSLGGVLSAGGYQETGTGENEEVIIKYSGFSNPGSKIVFLEEQAGDGINQNYWNVFLNQRRWWDPFAIVHNGSSTFSYADGHADKHKWTDDVMIEMAKNGTKDEMASENSDDYEWFVRAYVPGG